MSAAQVSARSVHQTQVGIHLDLGSGLPAELADRSEGADHAPTATGMVVAQPAAVGVERNDPVGSQQRPFGHERTALTLLAETEVLERDHDGDRERVVDGGVADVGRFHTRHGEGIPAGADRRARAVLPHMRASGYGRVVAIGSSAGITCGARNVAAYAASKGGLLAFAKSIAREYAPFGITSNAVAPAFIDTEMIAGKGDFSDEIPVGRMGTPSDVASLVTYLCSQESGYVTGEVIDLNGGFFID